MVFGRGASYIKYPWTNTCPLLLLHWHHGYIAQCIKFVFQVFLRKEKELHRLSVYSLLQLQKQKMNITNLVNKHYGNRVTLREQNLS